MSSIDRESSAQGKQVDEKKSYISPHFCEYGSIAKLTQSGTGTGADGDTTAGMMMVCL
jgi:hypothetical protein